MPKLLLVDNGSTRPDSTRTLRRLAGALGERLGTTVHPVSLKHADRVPAERLDGRPADTLLPFLERSLDQGTRDFLVLPLAFGPSAALADVIPHTVAALQAARGPLALRIAPGLCPLPPGEPTLARILADQVASTAARERLIPRRVVLVDHGSPRPQASAVRAWLAARLQGLLGDRTRVDQAAMERRPGPEYDFNGDLLETALGRLALQDPGTPAVLAMLFLAPGRHAGPQGDIAEICRRVEARVPGFRAYPTPLVGEHPALIDILAQRATAIGAIAPSDSGSAGRP